MYSNRQLFNLIERTPKQVKAVTLLRMSILILAVIKRTTTGLNMYEQCGYKVSVRCNGQWVYALAYNEGFPGELD